jgi:hypothetical protein
MQQDQSERVQFEEDQEEESFKPTGTFLFVILMLAGYALYWAYIWFIVVIEQGYKI